MPTRGLRPGVRSVDLYIAADIEAPASRHQENWLQDNAKSELSRKSNYLLSLLWLLNLNIIFDIQISVKY